MRTNSVGSLLLIATVVDIAAWAMVKDPLVTITCFLGFTISRPPESICEHTPYLGVTKTLCNHCVFEPCPDNIQDSRLNCCLYAVIVLYATSAVIVIAMALSVPFWLSGSQTLLEARYTNVKSRGRYYSTHAVSLKDGLRPERSTPVGDFSANVFERPSLVTQGIQSNSGNETAQGGNIYSGVLASIAIAPNPQRGPSYPVRQPSLETHDNQLSHSKTTWSSLFANFWPSASLSTASVWSSFSRCCYMPRITNTYPLYSLRGLCPTLFALVIAVDEDIECLKILWSIPGVSEPGRINFHGLDEKVSLAKVYDTIKRLYDEATELLGSELLVVLTGHGDNVNRMQLHGGEFIGETDLYEFFKLLKLQDINSTPIPVTILFDICRKADKPSDEPPEGISLIWTCCPGEYAHSFRLPRDPKIPHSCFLLALMMVARIPDTARTDEAFKNSVKEHLDQLTAYLKEAHCLNHSKGKCHLCINSDELCKEPQQNIDWRNAKNLNGILMFADALLGTNAAQEARRRITTSTMFCRVNKLPVVALEGPESKSPSSLTTEGTTNIKSDLVNVPNHGTRGHIRGANGSVHAG
ncbi:hypothetical protein B0J17DRAFT_262931 [Rhizoctonia solani]|nr:hypothetical protein B0J17DRAFT_262931 [Rhizoctonia solani]